MSVSYSKKVVFLVQEDGEAPREATPQDFARAGFVPASIHSERAEEPAAEKAEEKPAGASFWGDGDAGAGFCFGFGLDPKDVGDILATVPVVAGEFLVDVVDGLGGVVDSVLDFLDPSVERSEEADEPAAEKSESAAKAEEPAAEEKAEPEAPKAKAQPGAKCGTPEREAEEKAALDGLIQLGLTEEEALKTVRFVEGLGGKVGSLLPSEDEIRGLFDLFKGGKGLF